MRLWVAASLSSSVFDWFHSFLAVCCVLSIYLSKYTTMCIMCMCEDWTIYSDIFSYIWQLLSHITHFSACLSCNIPRRFAGFLLKSALSKLCTSGLRNCGIPSLALHTNGEQCFYINANSLMYWHQTWTPGLQDEVWRGVACFLFHLGTMFLIFIF